MLTSLNNSILVEASNNVCTVTLNRTKSLNALNWDMVKALLDITIQLKNAPEIRAVVLRGAGQNFMAGGDIKGFKTFLDQAPTRSSIQSEFEGELEEVHKVIYNMRTLPIPVIASIRGAAAGAGLSFVLACDLAICTEKAFFTLAYCRIGTSPDGGSTFFLPRSVGFKKAMEIALLGNRFNAQKAFELGLVNYIVNDDQLENETSILLKQITQSSAVALAETKKLLNNSLCANLTEQLNAETRAFVNCSTKPDFYEGVSAFIEKREPLFE